MMLIDGEHKDPNRNTLEKFLKGKFTDIQIKRILNNIENGKLSHNHALEGNQYKKDNIWCFHITPTGNPNITGKYRVLYYFENGLIKDINDKH